MKKHSWMIYLMFTGISVLLLQCKKEEEDKTGKGISPKTNHRAIFSKR
jgi:hypothetical protein